MSETQSYTDEFRREVVRRANSGAISVSDLARELDISASTIYRWRRTLAADEPMPAPSEPAAEVSPAAEKAPKAKKKDGKKKKDKKEKKGKKDGKGKQDKKKKGKKKK